MFDGLKKSFVFGAFVLCTSGVLSANDPVIYDWSLGMKTVAEEDVPAMVYFGDRNSSFFHGGINDEAQRILASRKVLLIQVDMKSKVPYPLSLEMKSAEHLANLVGALPGSIVMINKDGILVEEHRFARIVHDCDPIIIKDLLKFYSEGRDPKEQSVSQTFSVLEDTQDEWKALSRRLSHPNVILHTTKDDVPYLYVDDEGKEHNVAEIGDRFLVVAEAIERVSYVQVMELYANYAGNLKITVISRANQRKVFDEYFSDLKNVEFKVLAGSPLFEFPMMVYAKGNLALLCRGFLPSEFVGQFLGAKPSVSEAKKVDVNMPVGEYVRYSP